MGVIVPPNSAPAGGGSLIVPAGSAGRSTVEGYDPQKHDPFFDGVSQRDVRRRSRRRVERDEPPRQHDPVRPDDLDGVARVEVALHARHARRQQGGAPLAHGPRGTGVRFAEARG